jgi:hypothetical protein
VIHVIFQRFDRPDEVGGFEKGRFELVHIGGITIGCVTHPGWKWSVNIGKWLAEKSCDVEHVGVVLAGSAAAMYDGRVIEMQGGGHISQCVWSSELGVGV